MSSNRLTNRRGSLDNQYLNMPEVLANARVRSTELKEDTMLTESNLESTEKIDNNNVNIISNEINIEVDDDIDNEDKLENQVKIVNNNNNNHINEEEEEEINNTNSTITTTTTTTTTIIQDEPKEFDGDIMKWKKDAIKLASKQYQRENPLAQSRLNNRRKSIDDTALLSIDERRKKFPNSEFLKVNVLQILKSGTSFLKFGRIGQPHFRHIQLSDNNMSIKWFSSKKIHNTTIPVANIIQIILGQKTKVFKRSNDFIELKRSSFSIVYSSKSKIFKKKLLKL